MFRKELSMLLGGVPEINRWYPVENGGKEVSTRILFFNKLACSSPQKASFHVMLPTVCYHPRHMFKLKILNQRGKLENACLIMYHSLMASLRRAHVSPALSAGSMSM